MRYKISIMLSLFTLLIFSGELTRAGQERHGQWTVLLEKHVRDGNVDYAAFKKDEALLDEYLQFLDITNPANLDKDERLAFYINSYNAYTIKLILNNFKDGRPVDSIKKLGGFFTGPWKIKFCKIGGQVYTLDNIEHDIIRPLFREPRIHFAVNCASKSCPPLISEAYEGYVIDQQLDNNTKRFLGDSRFNYIRGQTLYVSKIFQWFAEDFNGDILGFITSYAAGSMKDEIDRQAESIEVKYLEYDWSLNSK